MKGQDYLSAFEYVFANLFIKEPDLLSRNLSTEDVGM
jgi:hypothetical protein